MFAKCANPVCYVSFDHHLHGKFFRFHRGKEVSKEGEGAASARNCSHEVEHYWLCAQCSQILTLAYVEGCGVVLKPRLDRLSTPETVRDLTAA